MNRRPARVGRRALAIGSLFLVMSACGGSGAADPSSGATATANDRPAAVVGAELDGVKFDVRRDPG